MVFGVTLSVFSRATMALEPNKAVDITLATIALHNMLRMESWEKYTADGYLDTESEDGNIISGDWRADAVDLTKSFPKNKSNRATASAERMRNLLADNFYGPGQIPWQWNILV